VARVRTCRPIRSNFDIELRIGGRIARQGYRPAARGLRAHGITQRELDLMYKTNPAKLLGLPPPEELVVLPATARQ